MNTNSILSAFLMNRSIEECKTEKDSKGNEFLDDETKESPTPSTVWEKTRGFFKTYFLQGQQLDSKATKADHNAPFLIRHRKLIAISVPALIVHSIWWTIMAKNDYFYLFTEPSGSFGKPRYLMSITMIFGSMVAGATSEGGGAVAFPVMTLALGVTPSVARDFSFMIQSVGMVASAFTILVMRVAIEWKALIYISLGGIAGIIVGLEYVAPKLSPPYSKMYFVAIWSSFAMGLFLLNRNYNRTVFDGIPNFEEGVVWRAPGCLKKYISINWKRETLFCFGVLGGVFSAMAGSGIDICSFAVLTLLFRVSEKVATPTSVILMAINACIGFGYRQFGMGGVEEDAWGFFAVCVPIVVIGAPVGALIGSHWHRLALASIIYVLDTAQLVGALYVIQPWTTKKTDTPLHLSLTSVIIFVCGAIFFRLLSYLGLRMMTDIEKKAEYTRNTQQGDNAISLEERNNRIAAQETNPESDGHRE